MPRSVKRGLDYLPLSVALNEKFELLEAEFGLTGFAVVLKLYQRIYGGHGYYCEWNGDIALVFARQNGIAREALNAIVQAAARRGIFDWALLQEQGILTSAGVQRRYFEAVIRRSAVEVRSDFLLLPLESLPDNVCIDGVSVDNLRQNADRNPQSKAEKSTEEKEQSSAEEAKCSAPQAQALAYARAHLPQLSANNLRQLRSFAEKLPCELVIHAIDEACAAGKRSYSYVRSILQRYVGEGLKSLDEVQRQQKRRANPALNYMQRNVEEMNLEGYFLNLDAGKDDEQYAGT